MSTHHKFQNLPHRQMALMLYASTWWNKAGIPPPKNTKYYLDVLWLVWIQNLFWGRPIKVILAFRVHHNAAALRKRSQLSLDWQVWQGCIYSTHSLAEQLIIFVYIVFTHTEKLFCWEISWNFFYRDWALALLTRNRNCSNYAVCRNWTIEPYRLFGGFKGFHNAN